MSRAQLCNETWAETGEIGGPSNDAREQHEAYLAELERQKEALDREKEAKANKQAEEKARKDALAIREEGEGEEDSGP